MRKIRANDPQGILCVEPHGKEVTYTIHEDGGAFVIDVGSGRLTGDAGIIRFPSEDDAVRFLREHAEVLSEE